MHPAFRQIAGDGRTATEKSFWELKGWEITHTWPGRVLLVVVTLIGMSAFNSLTGARGPSQEERAAFHRALTLLSEGDTAAMRGLEEPPRSKSLRPAWAIMMGGRDVLLHMAATHQRLGLPDDVPESWMSNDHVLRPSSHPEIGAFWDGLMAYHRLYADSAFALTERAVIGYAALARVDPRDMKVELEALREASRTTTEIHRTALDLAVTGWSIHRQLQGYEGRLTIDYAGDIIFPFDTWLEQYSRNFDRLELLAVRIDSLEKAQAERAKADLATLAPR